MSIDKFQSKYRIDSARAKWHDYDDGFYFVTICTKDREYFFGTIKDNAMILSEIGKFTHQQLLLFSEHNEFIEILSSVIMPNHIHLIIAIDRTKLPHKKRDIPIIEMSGNDRFRDKMFDIETLHEETFHEETFHETSLQNVTKQQSWLSVAIRLFKQSVTRFANQNGILFGWQERFHDHIIRNQKEMDYITEYIENNVKNWNEDLFHTL